MARAISTRTTRRTRASIRTTSPTPFAGASTTGRPTGGSRPSSAGGSPSGGAGARSGGGRRRSRVLELRPDEVVALGPARARRHLRHELLRRRVVGTDRGRARVARRAPAGRPDLLRQDRSLRRDLHGVHVPPADADRARRDCLPHPVHRPPAGRGCRGGTRGAPAGGGGGRVKEGAGGPRGGRGQGGAGEPRPHRTGGRPPRRAPPPRRHRRHAPRPVRRGRHDPGPLRAGRPAVRRRGRARLRGRDGQSDDEGGVPGPRPTRRRAPRGHPARVAHGPRSPRPPGRRDDRLPLLRQALEPRLVRRDQPRPRRARPAQGARRGGAPRPEAPRRARRPRPGDRGERPRQQRARDLPARRDHLPRRFLRLCDEVHRGPGAAHGSGADPARDEPADPRAGDRGLPCHRLRRHGARGLLPGRRPHSGERDQHDPRVHRHERVRAHVGGLRARLRRAARASDRARARAPQGKGVVAVDVAIAGGGTGGHTSPGLAVAALLHERSIACVWIGSRAGVEARRVPERGIPYFAIPTGKLRRAWAWQNVFDLAVNVPAGVASAARLLVRLRPRVVFATGGFVALPVVLAAATLRVPIVIHEQTTVPGLANRIGARFARRIAVTFPDGGGHFPAAKVVVTGNPLRPELRGGSPHDAVERFGLDAALPLVYVTGGAQGAQRINRAVGDALASLLERAQVIHQCGDNPSTGDRQWLEAPRVPLPAALRARYTIVPYVGAEVAGTYAGTALLAGPARGGHPYPCLPVR